jgi:hypothetical protein
MAKVGYIFKADRYDGFEADKEWMQKYGCVQVIEELVENEALRPRWKQLVANLERGDEIVVAKFSNALRGSRELSAFIELCRIKVVRIISIHDRIDSRGKLFSRCTGYVRGATRRGGGIAVFVRTCHESATESEGPEKNDEGDG